MEFAITFLSGVAGGLILNVMPCVFPVLFFKLQSWIAHADSSASHKRVDALAYLGGSLVTFSVFAVAVIALRTSGQSLGWGMQMQNPGFVAFLVGLLFAFGLNAIDVFSFSVSVSGGGRKGWVGSFTDGAMITLVSTPCSAPFLGGAATYALAGDAAWWETLVLFWSIGVGLSLPVLAIGFIPALNRLLPRPGAWMETMKVLVAFTLFGAAIWLYGVLQAQITPESATDFLWFTLALTAGLWAWQRVKAKDWQAGARWGGQLLALGAIVGAGFWLLHFEARSRDAGTVAAAGESSVTDGKLVWTAYSDEALATAKGRNQPVFIDFTADWCLTCKTFEKTHINVPEVIAAFDETRTLAVKADLTSQESQLWDVLAKYGRSGLPAYVFLKPDGSQEVLPEGPPMKLAAKIRAVAGASR
ncbi:MAG: thioredoxin family protein [Myxococcales bacterium]|nr:thioredoxin family protein [Myxococcales bacterium]MCB9522319.1 thioredoxin family protein [Myxococcales bacterium]